MCYKSKLVDVFDGRQTQGETHHQVEIECSRLLYRLSEALAFVHRMGTVGHHVLLNIASASLSGISILNSCSQCQH